MKHVFTPQRLNIRDFAKEGVPQAATQKLANFPRLMEETSGVGGETLVHFSAAGYMKADAAAAEEPWITLSSHTTLAMTCQRCLEAMEVEVAFDRSFRFVANEALAAIEDEESEEDVLVDSPAFNLLALIEDEILMAMPPAPVHAICPQALCTRAADPDFVEDEESSAHPFSVLQQLKPSAPTSESGSD